MKKRGVIYARYSCDNQREESIDGQIRECTAFANSNDIEIISTYIDRFSRNRRQALLRGILKDGIKIYRC